MFNQRELHIHRRKKKFCFFALLSILPTYSRNITRFPQTNIHFLFNSPFPKHLITICEPKNYSNWLNDMLHVTTKLPVQPESIKETNSSSKEKEKKNKNKKMRNISTSTIGLYRNKLLQRHHFNKRCWSFPLFGSNEDKESITGNIWKCWMYFDVKSQNSQTFSHNITFAINKINRNQCFSSNFYTLYM